MVKNSNGRFILYAAGIFNCYFYFGILQERITRGKYTITELNGNNETVETTERFTYMLALCGVQCLANYLFAKGLLFCWPQQEDKTRNTYYASSSFTYLLAMVCSNMALQWVPYPTQVVGKSAKPIPVMLLGVLIGHKSYPLKKYLFVLLIVSGVVLFMLKDKAKKADTESHFGIGQVLLLLSLILDGLTGAVQERIRAESAPSGQQMMLSMNAWSCAFLAVALTFTGEGFSFAAFCSRHPEVLHQLGTLAIAGALGQLFILLMVSEYGPLPCSIVTTTRKFFTVLGSVFIFGNALSFRQWFGAAAVFTGLFLDTIFGKSPPKKMATDLANSENRVLLKNGIRLEMLGKFERYKGTLPEIEFHHFNYTGFQK
ncbi:solute carrier family 35 member B1 homolog [Chrysoperla carnea]|uniref:solute carrier family 35 member B1 homolog n=1 Tax=Chrysoperla carnea TaxID=189513 RepID=UPI001D0836D2|nr:solute carrier family 35 member B1 homolog [Chrysoperla carnea]